jgi:hypothetical protein
MRIIGHIEHPVMKITVFKMDEKRSVKFETALFEQTYKFRAFEGFSSFEEITKMIDDAFIKTVEQQFIAMNELKFSAMQRFLPVEEQAEFEEII